MAIDITQFKLGDEILEGTINLPLLSKENEPVECILYSSGNDSSDITTNYKYQLNTLNYILEKEDYLQGVILTALLVKYLEWREEFKAEEWYSDDELDEVMPIVVNPKDLLSIMGVSECMVARDSLQEQAYYGLQFWCTFEEEHGFSVVMYKDRVLGIELSCDIYHSNGVIEEDLLKQQGEVSE